MAVVFVALGSNLDNPKEHIERAIAELRADRRLHFIAASNLYSSKAVGPGHQPDYCNAVVNLSTELKPESLLDLLQAVENQHRRVRVQRWGARTLDLDLLLFEHITLHSKRLCIPHPRMHERAFVLIPLADLTGVDFYIGDKSVNQLLEKCVDRGTVQRLAV